MPVIATRPEGAAAIPPIIGRALLLLPFAWLSAAAFAASLGFFLYSYLVLFGEARSVPADGVAGPAAVNVLLFSAFALHHSVFARTGLKGAMSALVGTA